MCMQRVLQRPLQVFVTLKQVNIGACFCFGCSNLYTCSDLLCHSSGFGLYFDGTWPTGRWLNNLFIRFSSQRCKVLLLTVIPSSKTFWPFLLERHLLTCNQIIWGKGQMGLLPPWLVIAYKGVFEIIFDWETKQLFRNWSLMGGGQLQDVVPMRELTVVVIYLSIWIHVVQSFVHY